MEIYLYLTEQQSTRNSKMNNYQSGLSLFVSSNQDLVKKYLPKNYTRVYGWCDPRIPANSFAGTCGFFQQDRLGFGVIDIPDGVINQKKHMFNVSEELVKYMVPTYWVGRDLLLAVSKTDPPESTTPSDIKWANEAMLFLLPDGALKMNNLNYKWIAISRSNVPGRGLCVNIITQTECGATITGSFGNNDDLSSIKEVISDYTQNDTREREVVFSIEDRLDFNNRVLRITFNLIMLMTERPDIVECTESSSVVMKKGVVKGRVYNPKWIGRKYVLSKNDHKGGTHNSPILHWRRGHWKNQPWGPLRSKRKHIWIEPTVVCPNNKPEELELKAIGVTSDGSTKEQYETQQNILV